jgi:uncharacterized protein (TIRG00374 family)
MVAGHDRIRGPRGPGLPARPGEPIITDAPPVPTPDEAKPTAPGDPVEAGPPPPARRRRGPLRWIPRPVLHVGRLLIIALIVEYLVLPQLAGSRKALRTLGRVDPLLLGLGVLLEALALLSYAQLARAVIPADEDPGLFKLLRIQLTTLSVSHCVPGGSAAGSSLGYRLLSAAGVRRSDVGFALAAQGLGSAVVLNVIFWVALVVSIPIYGLFSARSSNVALNELYVTAAVIGALLVGAFIFLVLLFSRGERVADRLLQRVTHRVPFVNERAVHSLFVRLTERLHTLAHQRTVLARAVGWAAANWLFDAASLYVFVGAFGHWVNIDGLLVAYGLAYILAAIPLTPGGLGVVEATLTTALVGFDTTRAIAILAVVGYRLVNFWLPIPLGGIAYVSLQIDPLPGRTRREKWRRIGDHAWGAAARGRREHAEYGRSVDEDDRVDV